MNEGKCKEQRSRLRELLRRAVGGVGAVVIATTMVTPADAVTEVETPVSPQERVQILKQASNADPLLNEATSVDQIRTMQYWPNWGNWNNWPNWGNWGNWGNY